MNKPLHNRWVTNGETCGGLTGVWCLGSLHAGPDSPRFVLPCIPEAGVAQYRVPGGTSWRLVLPSPGSVSGGANFCHETTQTYQADQ
jgi:hypothetical protein